MINLQLKCPHCDAPVEARYQPAQEAIEAYLFTGWPEELEFNGCNICQSCSKAVDLDALLPLARAEYDRLLSGIVSDL